MDFEQVTPKLPSRETLDDFGAALEKAGPQELPIQKLIDSNEELLRPLEVAELVRHLRFPKRNKIDPAQPPGPHQVRIPDFNGVRYVPIEMPVIIEMKSPNADILDSSTLLLSTTSREVTGQVQTAVMHLLRGKETTSRHQEFRALIRKVVDADQLSRFERLDAYSGAAPIGPELIDIMHRLLDQGVGLFALIGKSDEFADRQEMLESARNSYLGEGCVLVTYDELLLMNELLCDYCSRDSSLMAYFSESRTVELHNGGKLRFGEHVLLSTQMVYELQQKIHRLPGDVCLFGFGGPPPPSTPEASFRVNAAFDIGMIWSQPTHLKGQERLVWAGRYDSSWLVVKQRLTEPLIGGYVWYEFAPPTEVEPVFR